ncbi:c-type cytochrome [Stieleria sp. TO1_6]|uniref:c-type cytochrome n=1 Tax=Stieleria tagensis TaxID=2956795 RepID=UPI00209A7A24|nr:c-type cytochrome [Stieleria tagensis]MCO8124829.1 c-type cytochrome [Stieleria tagensis]
MLLQPHRYRLTLFALAACWSLGVFHWKPAQAELGVTPPEQFSVPAGFEVQLVYDVPNKEQGSWVSLTVDPKGRLLASDQNGSLYRIDVSGDKADVQPLKVKIGSAQGLLFAFDSLYVNVNGGKQANGVYRLRDTNGDDQFDQTELILPLDGGGEHGPHALILSADGKRILTCGGNMTKLPKEVAHSRVPQVWAEDHLLGRMPDARGHAADRMAPGGWIGSFFPDGSDFELIASGFRNEYDIALNDQGELFSYDADMEWDVGTPWYRPTRVTHVISAAEFGWRNGTGKWPAYLPDSFDAAVNIGAGSPTGICFGYGTKFPSKYRSALFIADWSYGNIHAVHLTPDGSTYTGTYETFATAAPLPVTDMVVRPQDGALYFAVGGRGTQSGLYRVIYTGDMVDETIDEMADAKTQKAVKLRKRLESFHTGPANNKAIGPAIRHLASPDRAIRFAARTALEHQPVDQWRDKIETIENDQARALAVVALARTGTADDKAIAMQALKRCDWDSLSPQGRIDLLRAYALVAIRLGEFNDDESAAIAEQISGQFPTGDDNVDRELAQMLVYLKVPGATQQIVHEMLAAPSQENQIFYALTLRGASQGWDEPTYRDYFGWFNDVQSARGGMSFGGFIKNIKDAALENVPAEIKTKLADVLAAPKVKETETEQREFVQKWTVDDLLGTVSDSNRKPNFENGKSVFATAQCYKCHRMGIQGGILGPDLTGAGGRFSHKDLLTAMIDPNQAISDQYGSTQFLTEDGKIVVGRVVNMSGNKLRVMTNMLDPSSLAEVNTEEIETTQPSKTSLMPSGLLDTFTAEDIADLVAYLRAGGNQASPIYQSTVAGK